MSLLTRTQTFLTNSAKNRPDLVILGEYQGSNNRILVEGVKCGHQWHTTPNNMRIGIGCPSCFHTRLSSTLTHSDETFKTNLNKLNNNYESIDVYEKSVNYMRFRCKLHDHIWTMRAGHIRIDSCKMCKHASKATKIKHQIMRHYTEDGKPTIELLDDYVGYATPMRWKCLKDGYMSSAKPATLKNGNLVCFSCKHHLDSTNIINTINTLDPSITFVDDIELTESNPLVYFRVGKHPMVWEDYLKNIISNIKSGKYKK